MLTVFVSRVFISERESDSKKSGGKKTKLLTVIKRDSCKHILKGYLCCVTFFSFEISGKREFDPTQGRVAEKEQCSLFIKPLGCVYRMCDWNQYRYNSITRDIDNRICASISVRCWLKSSSWLFLFVVGLCYSVVSWSIWNRYIFSKYIDESLIFRTKADSNQLQIVHFMRLSVEEISKLQTITVQFA